MSNDNRHLGGGCSKKTYTQQVWSIVYLFLGFVRTSYTVSSGSALSFLSNLTVKGAGGAFCNTMNGKNFILLKQQAWARRKGLELQPGTIGSDGKKVYVDDLDRNLFEPLSAESLLCYGEGNGNETQDGGKRRAKMKAIYSSSALVANLCQYWQKKGNVYPLLHACGLPVIRMVSETPKPLRLESIKFEEKFKIFPNTTPANIDVLIHSDYDFAIESKFCEPYESKSKKGLNASYVKDDSLWEGLSNLYELAKEISPNNGKFRYLDAAQLITHTLGLTRKYGTPYSDVQSSDGETVKVATKPHEFYLIYLWYDVFGEDGFKHREEIEQFARVAKADGIRFKHITYQEVIANLLEDFYQGNEAYCDYMAERYL